MVVDDYVLGVLYICKVNICYYMFIVNILNKFEIVYCFLGE